MQNGLTEEAVTLMKNTIGQRDVLRYETPVQKAMFISRIPGYNLPSDYVMIQNKILKSITQSQLKMSACQYINPDTLNIMLVGDKAKF